jgi:hypothetical protein
LRFRDLPNKEALGVKVPQDLFEAILDRERLTRQSRSEICSEAIARGLGLEITWEPKLRESAAATA